MPHSVFVTGADKGLGFALVRAFLQAGYQVYAGQHVADSPLNGLADEHGERLCVVPLDVTDGALNMRSKILQNHLKPRGFRVLAVHPGWMQTDMGGASATDDPADVAARVLRLATDVTMATDALFVTADGAAMDF